ncbi:hydantoin racemase (Dcg1), putative [Talaromyces stipitatus ATCC 10500]|uniref:Hydantoin racemase (Dcg1), putative n=1 Tax=Talaromyces stipitatus (strain ATCC 10500 / CBS 375.48 / QM 6759 / NRRL 1006) TaxID=441959 RepID=B8M251_TALSN|nr:hydantoin racemase (Dcg1), putative [Talaromyces stipitatus ATCC 10500]EED21515.1 hydantoin racemase (Dcg1), putative [Talaromyces stipitatus ATCC 10500]
MRNQTPTSSRSTPFRILIINPNTSTQMTESLKPIVQGLNYNDIQFDYFTAPNKHVTLPDGRVIEPVHSINSGEDSIQSAHHCRPFVEPLIPKYDAFLVACYSAHPLVGMLRSTIKALENKARHSDSGTLHVFVEEEINPGKAKKYVTGIFEASVTSSLMLISSFHLLADWSHHKAQSQDTWGIVTTGAVWKEELTKAVGFMINGPEESEEKRRKLLNAEHTSPTPSPAPPSVPRFAGVETTGLTAVELHKTPPEEVRRRIIDATEKILKGSSHPVRAVCLGCAGMAGMEEAVRAGCIKAYGETEGENVHIVDGVVAGVGLLVNSCKSRPVLKNSTEIANGANPQNSNALFFNRPVSGRLPQNISDLHLGGEADFYKERRHHLEVLGFHALPEDKKAPIGAVEFEGVRGPHGTIPIRLFYPRAIISKAKDDGEDKQVVVLVYMHGGGYTVGSVDEFENGLRLLAEAADVISDHRCRVPPRSRTSFPDPIRRILRMIDWAQGPEGQSRGINPNLVFGGGDSAGGNMTAALALRRQDQRLKNMAGQILLYPEARIPFDTPAATENNTGGSLYLVCNGIFSFADHYLPKSPREGAYPPSHRYVSPGMQKVEDLQANLPPVALFTCGWDPLRDVAVEYGSKLQEAGVQVNWHHYEHLTHGFLQFAPWSKERMDATMDVAKVLKKMAYS